MDEDTCVFVYSLRPVSRLTSLYPVLGGWQSSHYIFHTPSPDAYASIKPLKDTGRSLRIGGKGERELLFGFSSCPHVTAAEDGCANGPRLPSGLPAPAAPRPLRGL